MAIYVTMTDSFLSGWGLADNRISKFVVICDNLKQAETIRENAMAASPCVSCLIGIELDKIINRIGNTGWDYLSSYYENKDLIKTAINRYKSN